MTGPGVLICVPTLQTGGAERQLRMLAPRLASRGIRTALFSRIGDGDAAALAAAGVRCFQAPRGHYSPRLLTALRAAAAAAKADVIHTFLPQMDVAGGAVALLTRRPWLLSERSSAAAYGTGFKDGLRFRMGRRATAIVANSDAGLDVWSNHSDRLVIPNGIDHEAVSRAPPLSPADMAMAAGRTVIVAVARLTETKRLDLVVEAVGRLVPAHPDLLLLLIGEGPDEAALTAQAVAFGDHVRLLGQREDVLSWLARADLFVSASVFEGHPNAVLEAAAAGVPMVLTDIPMHRGAVGPDGARFVPIDDVSALAGGLAAMLDGEGERRQCAEAAKRHVQPLSIDRAADLYAALYRRLAAAGS